MGPKQYGSHIYIESTSLLPYRANGGGSEDILSTKEAEGYSSNWVENCSSSDA